MSKHVVVEAVRNYLQLKDDLNEFLELKKNAFRIFHPKTRTFSKDATVMSICTESWQDLFNWTSHEGYHFLYLDTPDYDNIENFFFQLTSHKISYEKFDVLIEPARRDIEKYISELEAEIEKKHKELLKLFDDFEAFKTSELSFIFKEPAVKELFFNFLFS